MRQWAGTSFSVADWRNNYSMYETTNGMKLMLSYNINSNDAQAYYEFVLSRYIPVMQSMGLELSEAWHTAYGEYPNRLICFVCDDHETMVSVLENEVWDTLNDQLMEYVTEFSYKVIPYKLGFQI
jgi:hypothetical protein